MSAQYKIPESVLVVIHTADLQVLLLERADKAGFWQSVTGSRDPHEARLADTAQREVREETGAWILNLIVMDVGRNYARVYVASKYDFSEVDDSTPTNAITVLRRRAKLTALTAESEDYGPEGISGRKIARFFWRGS